MGALKVELSNKFNQIVYFHTSADIVYFNRRLTPGITAMTAEQAIVQLNQRINEMIILNEDMENEIKEIQTKVDTISDKLGEKVTMFSLTSYINKEKFESTNGKAPYTQKIVLTGVKETDEVIIGPVQSADYKVAQKQLEAYNCISRQITNDGSISLVCYQEVPTMNIPIKVLVLRKS